MIKTLDAIAKVALANTSHAACFWDTETKLGVLIERDGTILAAMDYRIEKSLLARVQQSGSLQGGVGYGYCIYLHAMAALGSELMLSPDTTNSSPGANRLWESLFQAGGIPKQSMFGTEAYLPVMDETYDEGVIITNPNLFEEEWAAYETLGQLQERIASGKLQPHLANWGFSLPQPYQASMARAIRSIDFTEQQKRVIYDYLSCAFQLAKSRYMIPMKLPKRSQVNLSEYGAG